METQKVVDGQASTRGECAPLMVVAFSHVVETSAEVRSADEESATHLPSTAQAIAFALATVSADVVDRVPAAGSKIEEAPAGANRRQNDRLTQSIAATSCIARSAEGVDQ